MLDASGKLLFGDDVRAKEDEGVGCFPLLLWFGGIRTAALVDDAAQGQTLCGSSTG